MGPTSEDRWLEAERRIAPPASPKRRRASRRAWLLLILAAVAYGIVSGVLRAVIGGGDGGVDADADGPLPPWSMPGLALSGAGALVVLIGTVAGFITRRLRPTRERVDGALTWRERRSARKRIRGREPVGARHQAVIRAIAEQDLRTAQAFVPCYLGTVLMAIGLVLALDLPEITAMMGELLILLAAAAVWQYGLTARAARAYLARG